MRSNLSFGLLVVFFAAVGCDQYPADNPGITLKPFSIDPHLVNRASQIAEQLEECEAPGKASACSSLVSNPGGLTIVLDDDPRPTLQFASLNSYREATYAIEAIAEFDGYAISIPSSLSQYADSAAYLTPVEISFFDQSGRLAIGDTLYTISGDNVNVTSLDGQLISSMSVWREAYAVSYNKSMGVDYAYSHETYAPGSLGGSYLVRGRAVNEAYNTGAPLYRSWAQAFTYVEYHDQGQWKGVPASILLNPEVKVSMTTKRRVWLSCVTRTESGVGETYVRVNGDRCDNQGVTSKHQALFYGSAVVWEGGAYPELNLQ